MDEGLHLPWGPYLEAHDVRELRDELVGMIEALAAIESWQRQALARAGGSKGSTNREEMNEEHAQTEAGGARLRHELLPRRICGKPGINFPRSVPRLRCVLSEVRR